jgi:hypothetical protein
MLQGSGTSLLPDTESTVTNTSAPAGNIVTTPNYIGNESSITYSSPKEHGAQATSHIAESSEAGVKDCIFAKKSSAVAKQAKTKAEQVEDLWRVHSKTHQVFGEESRRLENMSWRIMAMQQRKTQPEHFFERDSSPMMINPYHGIGSGSIDHLNAGNVFGFHQSSSEPNSHHAQAQMQQPTSHIFDGMEMFLPSEFNNALYDKNDHTMRPPMTEMKYPQNTSRNRTSIQKPSNTSASSVNNGIGQGGLFCYHCRTNTTDTWHRSVTTPVIILCHNCILMLTQSTPIEDIIKKHEAPNSTTNEMPALTHSSDNPLAQIHQSSKLMEYSSSLHNAHKNQEPDNMNSIVKPRASYPQVDSHQSFNSSAALSASQSSLETSKDSLLAEYFQTEMRRMELINLMKGADLGINPSFVNPELARLSQEFQRAMSQTNLHASTSASAESLPALFAYNKNPSAAPSGFRKRLSSDASRTSESQGREGGCTNCGTRHTPLWRKSDIGELLCNACGLYLKTRKTHRPVHGMKPDDAGRKRVKSLTRKEE